MLVIFIPSGFKVNHWALGLPPLLTTGKCGLHCGTDYRDRAMISSAIRAHQVPSGHINLNCAEHLFVYLIKRKSKPTGETIYLRPFEFLAR